MKPFTKVIYQNHPFALIAGDSKDILKSIQDNAIDSLVTDPPSGIGILDSYWDKTPSREDFIQELQAVFTQAYRVLKPGAYAVVWSLPRTQHWTATAMENAGFEIRDIVTAIRSNGFPKHAACLKPAAENWILACKRKGLALPLNIEACRIPTTECLSGGAYSKNGKKSRDDGWGMATGGAGEYVQPSGRYPANVVFDHTEACTAQSCTPRCAIRSLQAKDLDRFFYAPSPRKSERDTFLPEGVNNPHRTVKPLELMKYLVKLITPEGGVVLDCFAGSGTTGLAALELNRRFIGVERDLKYCAIAHERLRQCLSTR